jgi:hypothetical protein
LLAGPGDRYAAAQKPFCLLSCIKRVGSISMILVAIAEDHPEMRVVLGLLLRLSSDMKLVCEAANGQEAVDCVKRS